MRKLLFLSCLALLLSACVVQLGPDPVIPITNYDERSTAYGWLDTTDVETNRLNYVNLYQFRPQTNKPYYEAKVVKFKNGFLYFSQALPLGSFKTISAGGQRCTGPLCGTTLYKYSFGKQGDAVAAVVIEKPGVYYLGAHKMKQTESAGFLSGQGKFTVVPAPNPPTQRELLEEVLRVAQKEDAPVMIDRIKYELRRMK
jgi:hypothetical protein